MQAQTLSDKLIFFYVPPEDNWKQNHRSLMDNKPKTNPLAGLHIKNDLWISH